MYSEQKKELLALKMQINLTNISKFSIIFQRVIIIPGIIQKIELIFYQIQKEICIMN